MNDAKEREPEVIVEERSHELPFRTAAEWEAHVRWRTLLNAKRTTGDFVREAIGTPIDKLEDLLFRGQRVSSADRVIAQGFRVLNDLAKRAQSGDRVIERYRSHGVPIRALPEIQQLDIEIIERVRPDFASTYQLMASVSGGAVGALGAIGGVVGVPTLLLTSLHAAGSFAGHFGHDLADADEREFAVMLLTAGLVTRPSHRGIVIERLEELAYNLETKNRAGAAEDHGLAILENVAEAVVLRLILGVLMRSWPGVGLVLGAGFSRAFVNYVSELSLAAYQQRWLFRKYGKAARFAMR